MIKGKVLWFDQLSGEGMVIDDQGHDFYLEFHALESVKKARKTLQNYPTFTKDVPNIVWPKDGDQVLFSLYTNLYMSQVDHCIVLK
jgi:hypothetical protein